MRSRLFSTGNKASLEAQLAGIRFPNLLLERKKLDQTYEHVALEAIKQRQLLVFSPELFDIKNFRLSEQLSSYLLMAHELYPELESKEIDLRLIVTSKEDPVDILLSCSAVNQQRNLAAPLYYTREVPGESSASCKIEDFQNKSILVGPDKLTEAVIDHGHKDALKLAEYTLAEVNESIGAFKHS